MVGSKKMFTPEITCQDCKRADRDRRSMDCLGSLSLEEAELKYGALPKERACPVHRDADPYPWAPKEIVTLETILKTRTGKIVAAILGLFAAVVALLAFRLLLIGKVNLLSTATDFFSLAG